MRAGPMFAVLGAVLVLAACSRTLDPPTPEQQALKTHEMIANGANTALFSDRLGYDSSDGEVERINTTCEDDRCALGFLTVHTAGGVGVNADGLMLLRERRGVTLFREDETLSWGEFQRYGGWLAHSLFTTDQYLITDSADPDHGVTLITSRSLGFSSGENPGAAEGSARWEGLMLGRDMRASPTRGQVIRGDADVTVDFAADGATAAVAFTRIVNIETGGLHDDMAWTGMALDKGAFALRNAPDDTISGRFYGPDEEEIGGVFERNGMAGAFGARRTSAP